MNVPGTPGAGRDFGRARRLVRKRDFQRVFDQPRRFSDACFTLLVRSGTDVPHARLGLAVSRRNARRAVDRHRIKRVVRESFRFAPGLPAVDIVVISKPAATHADRAALRASLDRHWRQIRRRFSDQDIRRDG